MRSALLYVLFFFSGTTALVYELVWVRELIFVFGGTTYAITTVLVAFMAGLGLGSYFAGRACRRMQAPARVFGYLEIGIGLYALAVPLLLGLADPIYRAVYPHVHQMPWLLTAVRFAVGGCVVLVPATLMGATLPVLVRHVTLGGHRLGRSVGYLYGVNTFGAVLGVLLAGFWLLPALGLSRTTMLAASVDVLVGVLTLLFLWAPVAAPARAGARRRAVPEPPVPATGWLRQAVLVGFAVSGFAAMVYQITWTRALVMSVGSSTYSFTCILAAFILGLALGSVAVAHWADRFRNPAAVFGVLELLIGLVAVVIVPIHGQIPYIVERLVRAHHAHYDVLLAWQFLLIIGVTLVPTLLMGAIFPLVIRALATEGTEAGDATGRAYAVNTIGTILGSFLTGFVLIRSEVLGVQNAILFASVLNGVVGVALIVLSRPAGAARAPRVAVPALGLALIAAIAIGAGRWDPRVMNVGVFLNRDYGPESHEIIYLAEGVDITVAVARDVEDPDALSMRVNGKPDASTNLQDIVNFVLLGHVPALIAPAEARDVCVIGLGSGLTMGALASYDYFERLDCVEISEEVLRAAVYFEPYTSHVLSREPRLELIEADGRNHLLLTDRTYDLIISQPSNPWMAGVSNLFTREFFEVAGTRLRERGLLCVWLQSYNMSQRDFEMVVRTLLDVFPHVTIWELDATNYMLVGTRAPLTVDVDLLEQRFHHPAVWADLYRAAAFRPGEILARYIASEDVLAPWCAAAPIHTDDNALLEFSAPRYLYAGEGLDIEGRLYALRENVAEVVEPDDRDDLARLADQMHSVTGSRVACLKFNDAMRRRDLSAALDTLLDARRRYPLDAELMRLATELVRDVRNRTPDRLRDPATAARIAALEQLPPAIVGPRRGASLAELAALRRAVADEAVRAGELAAAAANLREAWRMQPDDVVTGRQVAQLYLQAGDLEAAAGALDELLAVHPAQGRAHYDRARLAARLDDPAAAVRHLGAALRAAAVTSEEVRAEPAFQALHGDAEFEDLLRGSGAQPTPPAGRGAAAGAAP